MNTIQEGDLIFDVTDSKNAEKFDDSAIPARQSTMKRVDFIIEKEDRFIFLEVKDPDMPRAVNPGKLKQELQSGNLVPELAGKYRDSLLFAKLCEGYDDKPIDYIVLISMASLEDALILAKTDALKSAIPISHPKWSQNAANSCMILKLDAYKQVFGENSVWRKSDFEG